MILNVQSCKESLVKSQTCLVRRFKKMILSLNMSHRYIEQNNFIVFTVSAYSWFNFRINNVLCIILSDCLAAPGGFWQTADSRPDRTAEFCALTWIPAALRSTAASHWPVAWRSRRPCGGSHTLAAAARCHRLTPDR